MIIFNNDGVRFREVLELWDKDKRVHYLDWYNSVDKLSGRLAIADELVKYAIFDWQLALTKKALAACATYLKEHPPVDTPR